MGLQNIFEMVKADRYTADGREELAKAREADVEDRTYNIGEISQKTGLQKTANGWVKPKSGVASPNGSGGEVEKFVENNKSMWQKNVEKAPDGRLKELAAKSESKNVAEKEVAKMAKAELEKRNSESKPSANIKVSTLMDIDNKLWDKHGIQSGDEWRDNPDKFEDYKKTVKAELEKKGVTKLSRDMYKKLENENYHTLNRALEELGMYSKDSAPRALTGDCKVRVRK